MKISKALDEDLKAARKKRYMPTVGEEGMEIVAPPSYHQAKIENDGGRYLKCEYCRMVNQVDHGACDFCGASLPPKLDRDNFHMAEFINRKQAPYIDSSSTGCYSDNPLPIFELLRMPWKEE